MREKYVLRNFIAKLLSTGLVTLLGFVSRKVFLNYLGDEVMGLHGLLLSVISMLSLLELGIGNAIYFSLYKPLTEKDDKQISAIMKMYANIYRVIGFLVLAIGLVLMLFLKFFVSTSLPDYTLYSAYVIVLLDAALSYYMAYRRNIFNADQKEYFNTNVDTFVNISVACLQMFAVFLTGNFYLFLLIKMIGTVLGNLFIYYKSDAKYPYLKKESDYKLSKEFMDTFIGNVKALCVVNISSYLVFGTDNLLLSKYADLTAIFIYSNYSVILAAVNQVFHAVFNSMQASIGNFMVVEGKEKSYDLFKKIFFINFLITSYTSVALVTLYNDAMEFWMGKNYVWPLVIVACLVFNNYLRYIGQGIGVFKNAAGLYNPYPAFKYLTLMEGTVNIVASLFFILVCKMGVLGVFLGTSVSTLVNTVAVPHAVYKYYFGTGFFDYVRKYIQYLMLTVLYCIMSLVVCRLVKTDIIILNLAIGLVVSFLVPLGLSSLLYCKTEEFAFTWDMVKRYAGKVRGVFR